MIPPSFTYVRATSVDEALALAAEHGEDAKYLAGGQSLLPLMKLRFAAPGRADRPRPGHRAVLRPRRGHLRGDRRADQAPRRRPRRRCCASDVPLLAHTAEAVGDPQIRHRGTIGGSVAHARRGRRPARHAARAGRDSFVVRGQYGDPDGARRGVLPGIFETALEPGELLTEIQVPKPASPAAWSFQKFTKRAIDWAIVGVAVAGTGGRAGQHGLDAAARHRGGGRTGVAVRRSPTRPRWPRRARTPGSDIHASKAYREHLARVLVRRALEDAAARS